MTDKKRYIVYTGKQTELKTFNLGLMGFQAIKKDTKIQRKKGKLRFISKSGKPSRWLSSSTHKIMYAKDSMEILERL